MDYLLGKVTQQAMNYAIRSGVTLTATYAIKQSGKLLQSAPKSDVRDDLDEWQQVRLGLNRQELHPFDYRTLTSILATPA